MFLPSWGDFLTWVIVGETRKCKSDHLCHLSQILSCELWISNTCLQEVVMQQCTPPKPRDETIHSDPVSDGSEIMT